MAILNNQMVLVYSIHFLVVSEAKNGMVTMALSLPHSKFLVPLLRHFTMKPVLPSSIPQS